MLKNTIIKLYFFPVILILSITLGGLTGYFLGPNTKYLQPFSEIFIRLILITVIPLVFFSVSLAVARANALGKLGKLSICMFAVFLCME